MSSDPLETQEVLQPTCTQDEQRVVFGPQITPIVSAPFVINAGETCVPLDGGGRGVPEGWGPGERRGGLEVEGMCVLEAK